MVISLTQLFSNAFGHRARPDFCFPYLPRRIFQNEPYFFSHLLFLSRSFLASSDSFDEDPNAALNAADYAAPAGTKKAKKRKQNHKGAAGQATVVDNKVQELMWPYHPEDDFIAKVGSRRKQRERHRSRVANRAFFCCRFADVIFLALFPCCLSTTARHSLPHVQILVLTPE